MKTILKKNILAYSGKDQTQGVIYSFMSYERNCIAKNPIAHYMIKPENNLFKTNTQIIAQLWKSCSPLFKTDLQNYVKSLNLKNKALHVSKTNSYHLFVKIMYKVSKNYHFELNDEMLLFLKQNELDTVQSLIINGYLENTRDKQKYKFSIVIWEPVIILKKW